jgi:hypothetical protein
MFTGLETHDKCIAVSAMPGNKTLVVDGAPVRTSHGDVKWLDARPNHFGAQLSPYLEFQQYSDMMYV